MGHVGAHPEQVAWIEVRPDDRADRRAQLQQRVPHLGGRSFKQAAAAQGKERIAAEERAVLGEARREGDQYVVNGTKWHVTSYNLADYLFVQAVLENGEFAGEHVLLVVDLPWPGVEVVRTPHYSHHIADEHPIVAFTDVRVPVANLIGEEHKGFKTFMTNFNGERLGMAAQAVAYAQVCFDEALHWARQRSTFGAPLSTRQVIRHKLMDMLRAIDVARCHVYDLAWAQQHNHGDPNLRVARIAMAKVESTRCMQFCADSAVQILGGMGFMRGTKSERIYREVKVMMIGGGSEEIMKDLAARQLGI